jgi:predicted TPR repeat methyltransferase
LEAAPAAIATRANLALTLEKLGRLAEARGQVSEILRLTPDDPEALANLARLSRATGDHAASVAAGERLYALRPSEKLKAAVSRSYFLWFDAVDRDPEVAKKVAAAWRAFDPSDPVAEHMLAALRGGQAPARASDRYVARHFDEFAPTFDQTLRALGYRGPEHAAVALKRALPEAKGDLDIVDLGCGTGLLGPLVRPFARRLVGVDLAAKMLERAAEQGTYDELVQREVTAFLLGHPQSFDVALCLDTLVYIGDLEPVVRALASSLRPGGCFVFTIELLADAPPGATYSLHVAGRYAHAEPYVRATLAAHGLVVEHAEPIVVRIEYGEPVPRAGDDRAPRQRVGNDPPPPRDPRARPHARGRVQDRRSGPSGAALELSPYNSLSRRM